MKITVTCEPVFHLPLTVQDVQILCELAESHYDATCKQAAAVGGFLFGWSNAVGDLDMGIPVHVAGSTRQLDIALKALEMRSSGILDGRKAAGERAEKLARDLRVCLDRWPYIKPADCIIDTEAPNRADPRGHEHHG